MRDGTCEPLADETQRIPRSGFSRASRSDGDLPLFAGGQGRDAGDVVTDALVAAVSVAAAGLIVIAALALIASTH